MLGCFALLRRQSLLGDALAHAALPGVCLALPARPAARAAPAASPARSSPASLGTLFILAIVPLEPHQGRLPRSASSSRSSSARGIVLLTHIQKLPDGNQSGLDKFLFGQAATLLGATIVR